jgi:N-acetylglucosaminyl-diphospho-decaprenol L-rhamnosyltransferase
MARTSWSIDCWLTWFSIADSLWTSSSRRTSAILCRRAKGFGANHNAAFARSSADLFFVVNPDVRLRGDPFRNLVGWLDSKGAAAVGPLVRKPNGELEDSARQFPTVARLLGKLIDGTPGPDYPVDNGPLEVDWVAGMFIGFRRDAYAHVGGFDERYFLYYEDVDICRRLRLHAYKVVYDTTVSIIHDARRASRRNARLMGIHAASALRYLLSSYNERS